MGLHLHTSPWNHPHLPLVSHFKAVWVCVQWSKGKRDQNWNGQYYSSLLYNPILSVYTCIRISSECLWVFLSSQHHCSLAAVIFPEHIMRAEERPEQLTPPCPFAGCEKESSFCNSPTTHSREAVSSCQENSDACRFSLGFIISCHINHVELLLDAIRTLHSKHITVRLTTHP